MKKALTLFLFTVFLAAGITQMAVSANPQIVSERLTEQLQNLRSDELVRINIIMHEEFDTYSLLRNVEEMEREQRRSYVVSVLKDFSALSQKGVLADLNRLQSENKVTDITSLWVANVINCYATPGTVAELATRTDIALIDYDFYEIILDPSVRKDAYPEQGNPDNREITWNVSKVNAPQVWALGYNGEGVIVAVIDTGVNYNHNDLKNNVWVHPDYPFHGYNFVSNNNNPMDDQGHGTHCAGTVAGDGTSGSQTGIAPGAKIMCLKVLDSQGGGNQSSTWSAAQFAIDNGAHVLSLSLGWQHSWGPNRQVFRQTFNTVLAAGLIASVAAGNEGDQQGSYPIPDNVRTPGDCPPPWLHPDQTLAGGTSSVVCVGATNSNDGLAGFSGRGPLTWQAIAPFNDYAYQPGMGLIRPDISAPGVSIKSLAHYNNTGYESGWSGTSMATPAVAGVMALMLNKNIGLSAAQMDQILEQTTVVLTPGKNNNSGSGRVNALAAIQATPSPGPSYYAHTINDAAGNNNGQLDPGEAIQLTVSMANFSDMVVNDVTVNLTTESPYITITDGSEFYGNFALTSIIEIQNAFAFSVANNIPGGEVIKFFLNAVSGTDSWESSFSVTANGVTLNASNFTINDSNGNGNGNLDPGETVNIVIQIGNQGQVAAPNVISTLTSTSPDITINSGSFTIPVLNAGQSSQASFNVTVSPTAQVGTVVELDLAVVSGYYQYAASFFPKVGLIVEDFETGDFTQFPWQFAGNQPWQINNTGSYQGTFSARSGAIGNSQSSEIKVTLDVSGGDSIAFYRKVSSESGYDFLQFYIDNTKLGEWSGEVNWGRVSYPVTAGTKTFRWVYTKDIFVVSGQDRAWIDYVEFPGMADQTLAVNAGTDATICEGLAFQANATAQNYNNVLWTTSGTGTFNNSAILNPLYTPSQADIDAGSIILSLTAYGNAGASLTDQMQLNIMHMPAAPGPITGPSQVCSGYSAYFHVDKAVNAEWYVWELTPANAGSFSSNDTVVMITFTEGFTGSATLKVHGANSCGGGYFSEEFLLQIDDCTGIGELTTSGNLEISPNPNDGSFVVQPKTDFSGINTIKILNTKGQVVYTNQSELKGQLLINAQSLNSGLYFIVIENAQSVSVEKLIINK